MTRAKAKPRKASGECDVCGTDGVAVRYVENLNSSDLPKQWTCDFCYSTTMGCQPDAPVTGYHLAQAMNWLHAKLVKEVLPPRKRRGAEPQ